MLRTNLASRPFYNDRAVRVGIAALVVVVAALTAFNVLQVLSLNARSVETGARAEAAEAESGQLQQRAAAIRQALNTGDVDLVQQAAREANVLIGQRVFSWTELFNRFEGTLPADVRISAVEPQVDREGRLLLLVTVVARRVEDLNAFMDQLEVSGGLRDVIARQDETLEDGTLRAMLQGYYVAPADDPAAESPGASEPSGTQNESPAAPRVENEAPRGAAR